MIAGGTHPAHRSDHGMTSQRPLVLVASKLTAAIGMQDASGDIAVAGGSIVQRVDGDAGSHLRSD